MPPKNSGGSTKFPGGHKVIHRTAQTAFVRVVTPRSLRLETVFTYLCTLSQGLHTSENSRKSVKLEPARRL